MSSWYGWSLAVLFTAGLVAAVWFLVMHRPSRWWRLEAVNVYGWPALATLFYLRSMILLVVRWPPPNPTHWWQTLIGFVLLVLCDLLLAALLISYRRYARRQRSGKAYARKVE